MKLICTTRNRGRDGGDNKDCDDDDGVASGHHHEAGEALTALLSRRYAGKIVLET